MNHHSIPTVIIFSDGCSSGYAAHLEHGLHRRVVYGPTGPGATVSRSEMLAVIRGLESLRKPCNVIVHSDSQFVVKGFEEWRHGWKKRDWTKADGRPVLNRDLWDRLEHLAQVHRIKLVWIPRMSDERNWICDAYAELGKSMAEERTDCVL